MRLLLRGMGRCGYCFVFAVVQHFAGFVRKIAFLVLVCSVCIVVYRRDNGMYFAYQKL